MIKIQSPGVFSGNLLDYDSTHSINAKIDELVASNAYAVCDTAGDTAAKTITIQNYELRTGVQLVVKFTNTNSEENPTLNVSNTGAKPIYANGQAVGLSVIKSGYAFIIAYNGTQYEIVGGVSGSDMFIGTTAEWEALSSTQKAEYDGKIVNITDDYETGEFAISGVVAPNEISPTRESHVSGSYITFNNSIYVCKTNIAKNETLTIDTNIELASLPEKTVVCYDDDEPEPYTKPGHTVIDSSGSSVVDRAGLQFGDGFDITDDSTNNKTIVTPGDALARKSDISTIVCTGSTNTTGSTIAAGVYFYLNGALCKALANIANGATFTLNTNFEVVSVCEELRQLNSNKQDKTDNSLSTTAKTVVGGINELVQRLIPLQFGEGVDTIQIMMGPHEVAGVPTEGWYIYVYLGSANYVSCVHFAIGYFGPCAGMVYLRTFASSEQTTQWTKISP